MVLRSVVEPRDDILRQLCLMGVTLQQLFRITGINYGTINRAKSGTREPSPVNQKGAGIRQLQTFSRWLQRHKKTQKHIKFPVPVIHHPFPHRTTVNGLLYV